MSHGNGLYMGIDLSTQQLKIISCFQDLKIHSKYAFEFDDLKDKYPNLHKGVYSNTDVIETPVSVFIDALQILLNKMKAGNFPFEKVISISGSCQQHGTVYYSSDFDNLLKSMDKENPDSWSDFLNDGFSFKNAPNWQDRSTSQEIEDFEKCVGGAESLSKLTGSKSHYRFSGLQIRKRCKYNSEQFEKTAKINLISGFLMSLFTGKLEGIENSEACGMNLLDILKNDWNDELLSLILCKNAKIDLVSQSEEEQSYKKARKLLDPILKPTDWSPVSKFLVKSFGFNKNCKIYPFTGDNMSTILSIPLSSNDLLVSMGTSTTVLLVTEKYVPSVNYHVFKHPLEPNLYMNMLCYCNGALAREQVRDKINQKFEIENKSWEKFNEILQRNQSETNLDNKVGIYFPLGEIIPNVKSCRKEFEFDEKLKECHVPIEDEVKLIIESQALSNRLRVSPMLTSKNDENLDYLKELGAILRNDTLEIDNIKYSLEEFLKRPNNVYYVGGTSQNESILHKYNEILGPMKRGYKIEITDACALGNCFRAIWGSHKENGEFSEWINQHFDKAENLTELNVTNESEWLSYGRKLGILSLSEKRLLSN